MFVPSCSTSLQLSFLLLFRSKDPEAPEVSSAYGSGLQVGWRW